MTQVVYGAVDITDESSPFLKLFVGTEINRKNLVSGKETPTKELTGDFLALPHQVFLHPDNKSSSTGVSAALVDGQTLKVGSLVDGSFESAGQADLGDLVIQGPPAATASANGTSVVALATDEGLFVMSHSGSLTASNQTLDLDLAVNWPSPSFPSLAFVDGTLFMTFVYEGKLMITRRNRENTSHWTKPLPVGQKRLRVELPVALVASNGRLVVAATAKNGRVFCAARNSQGHWSPFERVGKRDTVSDYPPELCQHDGRIYIAICERDGDIFIAHSSFGSTKARLTGVAQPKSRVAVPKFTSLSSKSSEARKMRDHRIRLRKKRRERRREARKGKAVKWDTFSDMEKMKKEGKRAFEIDESFDFEFGEGRGARVKRRKGAKKRSRKVHAKKGKELKSITTQLVDGKNKRPQKKINQKRKNLPEKILRKQRRRRRERKDDEEEEKANIKYAARPVLLSRSMFESSGDSWSATREYSLRAKDSVVVRSLKGLLGENNAGFSVSVGTILLSDGVERQVFSINSPSGTLKVVVSEDGKSVQATIGDFSVENSLIPIGTRTAVTLDLDINLADGVVSLSVNGICAPGPRGGILSGVGSHEKQLRGLFEGDLVLGPCRANISTIEVFFLSFFSQCDFCFGGGGGELLFFIIFLLLFSFSDFTVFFYLFFIFSFLFLGDSKKNCTI